MSAVFVDADGVRLRAVVEGPESAPPVLVLHGFTGSAESMAAVSAPLAADHRVARLELVGHGESDAPDDVAPCAMDACSSSLSPGGSLAWVPLKRSIRSTQTNGYMSR